MAKKINKKIGSFYIGRLNSHYKNVYFVVLVGADQEFTIALVSSFLFLWLLIRWEVNLLTVSVIVFSTQNVEVVFYLMGEMGFSGPAWDSNFHIYMVHLRN